MYHEEFVPAQELLDTVKCFWYNRRDAGEESEFEVMPDGYAEIIFHFGSGCSIFADGGWQQLPSPFLMGLLNQPVRIKADNRLEIIAIRCYPWAVFDLLGIPSGKESMLPTGHPIAQLHTALNTLIAAHDCLDAIAITEAYLLGLRAKVATNSMLFKAGLAMTKASGTIPVNEVAHAAHATVRTLERQFKQSSGHTVKDVSAIMRFEQVRNHLWDQPKSSLAGLAHQFGYSDQSHLSREFKRFSGTTPAAFARKADERRRSFDQTFVAFIQS